MILEIEIVNWEKYNPRKDVKRPSWFAVDNRFYEDACFTSKMDLKEIGFWAFLLAKRSQLNPSYDGVTFKLDTRYTQVTLNLRRKTVLKYVLSFHNSNLIKLHNIDIIENDENSRNVRVTLQDKTLHNKTLHNTYASKPLDASREVIVSNLSNEGSATNLIEIKTPKKRKPKANDISAISCMQTIELGRSWFDFARFNQNWRTNISAEKFILGVDAVMRAAGLNIDQLTELFKWASEDKFWCDKIYSPSGLLRKSANESRKIDNLLSSFGRIYKKQRAQFDAYNDFINGEETDIFSSVGAV